MKFRRWEIALMIGVFVALGLAYGAEAASNRLEAGLVRLHVVADGNSEEQQALKLKVRDAVLEAVRPALEGASGREDAERRLQETLGQVGEAARECILANGQDLDVAVSLETEPFPTREYDTFALPAGEYLSLRVKIGSGGGRNWWCVVFPPLCSAASVEQFDDTLLTEDDRRLITRNGTSYVIKFKVVELWGRLKNAWK